jgi:hypothetical protein
VLVLVPVGPDTHSPVGPDFMAVDAAQAGPGDLVLAAREGNTVTATIDVPADASLGMLLDCHLEFESGQRTRAVKKNAVMRIVE